MEELPLEHTSGQWRIFTDLSELTLKAVLLHNGKKFPSVPLVHLVHMEERYEDNQVLLQRIRYEEYRWNMCGIDRLKCASCTVHTVLYCTVRSIGGVEVQLYCTGTEALYRPYGP